MPNSFSWNFALKPAKSEPLGKQQIGSNWDQRPEGGWWQASPDVTVHSRNHIRELIALTEFWKVRTIDALKKSNTPDETQRFSWIKSIHLELACLTAVQEMSEDQGFQMAFGRVLALLARDLDRLQKAARYVLKTEARKSLRKMKIGQALQCFVAQPSAIVTGNGSTTIGQTAAQVAAREIHQRNISMIRIVEAEAEGGTLYSVDNRRLGVFWLLEMTSKTKNVKVEAVAMSDLEWKEKFSTQTDGLIIEVSDGNGQIWPLAATPPIPYLPSSYPSLSSSLSIEDLESEDEAGPATKCSRVAWEWQGWSVGFWHVCWGGDAVGKGERNDVKGKARWSMWSDLEGVFVDLRIFARIETQILRTEKKDRKVV